MYVCSQRHEQEWAMVRFLLLKIGTVTRGNLLTICDDHSIQLNSFKISIHQPYTHT